MRESKRKIKSCFNCEWRIRYHGQVLGTCQNWTALKYGKHKTLNNKNKLTFPCWQSWEIWRLRQTKVCHSVLQPNIVSSGSRCLDARPRNLSEKVEVDRMEHECLWFSQRSLNIVCSLYDSPRITLSEVCSTVVYKFAKKYDSSFMHFSGNSNTT